MSRDRNMPKLTPARDLQVIQRWRQAVEKWMPLMPRVIQRLDGSRYLAIERPQTDEEFTKAGYTEMRSWQRGPNTIDRSDDQWPRTEEEYSADGWVPAKAWHHQPFPLDIASRELADAVIDLAVLAKREGLSAVPALWFARLLRSGMPSVAWLDQHVQVEILLEEIQLDRNAKPSARELDDMDRCVVRILAAAHGKLVKSTDLYARTMTAARAGHIGKDAFRARLRRLCQEKWVERLNYSYRSGRKAGPTG